MMSTNETATGGEQRVARLETPEMAGYRAGMASSHVIGRKLDRLYGLPSDMPRKMGEALRAIDRRMCG